MDEASNKKRIIIVTGASGVVGQEYVEYFSQQPHTTCVAVSRRDLGYQCENTTSVIVDLLHKQEVEHAFGSLNFSEIDEVVFIHPVGKFKYEENGIPEIDLDGDGIDDDIYKTNVETFTNVLRVLVPNIEEERQNGRDVHLALCGLGSISDKYQVKYWSSYTKAKDVLRSIVYTLVQERSEYVRGLFVNVSTVDTKNENELRSSADKSYWLEADELVRSSIPFLLHEIAGSWKQVDIFRESPYFREGYYEDWTLVRKAWQEQMKKSDQKDFSSEGGVSESKKGELRVREETQDFFGSEMRRKPR
jgi:NADP-dependent 3-hydroxy acid dehydrogenase YdfG